MSKLDQPGDTTFVPEDEIALEPEPLVLTEEVKERVTGMLQNEPLKAFYEVRGRLSEDATNITDWTKGIFALIKMESLDEAKEWIGGVYKVMIANIEAFQQKHGISLHISTANLESRIQKIEKYLEAFGHPEEAEISAEFRRLKTDLRSIFSCLGYYETHTGNLERALSYYEKVSDLDPNESAIVEQIIYLASHTDTPRTEEILKSSLQKLIEQEEFQKAHNACQDLMARHPEKLWLHDLAGEIVAAQGRSGHKQILG